VSDRLRSRLVPINAERLKKITQDHTLYRFNRWAEG